MAAWIKMPLGMELGLGPGDFELDGELAPSPKGGGAPSQFSAHFLWPNGQMHQDAAWHGCRPKPRGLCVRWRPSPPSQKEGGAPLQFSARVYCVQTAGWIKMVLGMELGLGPGDFVLDGVPAPLSQKWAETPPQFSVHFLGQTAGCIKMPHGMDVGLIPGDFVLYRDIWGLSLPSPKRSGAPKFLAHVYCGQTAGWIKMVLGMELGLGPVDFVLDGDPAPLHQKTTEPSPQFSAHFLWPNGWMHQDATLHGCVRWGPPIDDDSPAVTPPPLQHVGSIGEITPRRRLKRQVL